MSISNYNNTPLPVGPNAPKNNIALNYRDKPSADGDDDVSTTLSKHRLSVFNEMRQGFTRVVKFVKARMTTYGFKKEFQDLDPKGALALGFYAKSWTKSLHCHLCQLDFSNSNSAKTNTAAGLHIMTTKHINRYKEWATIVNKNSQASAEESSDGDDDSTLSKVDFDNLGGKRLFLGKSAESLKYTSNVAQYRFSVVEHDIKRDNKQLVRTFNKLDPEGKYCYGLYAKDNNTICCHVCDRVFDPNIHNKRRLLQKHLQSNRHFKLFSAFVESANETQSSDESSENDASDADDDDEEEEDDDESATSSSTSNSTQEPPQNSKATASNSLSKKSTNNFSHHADDEKGLTLEQKELKRQQFGINYFSSLIASIVNSSKTSPPAALLKQIPPWQREPTRREREDDEGPMVIFQ